jgi:spore coat polysaccharide biosynthesis predicted glycosyltransferase SpsG
MAQGAGGALMRVVFRAAAGPRIGFGHLMRCRSLARALGITPEVSIRGSHQTRETARSRGFFVSTLRLDALSGPGRPDILVVDDPSQEHADQWVSRARKAGVGVVTLHDCGIAATESDLGIDGSLRPGVLKSAVSLSGARFAVLDPTVAEVRALPVPDREGVLIALGGGEHVHRWGLPLAQAIHARVPDTPLLLVSGFTNELAVDVDGAAWLSAPDGLSHALRAAEVAVVAGGVTLYEAAALGTPVVGMAVVGAQCETIQAFADRGAALNAGLVSQPGAEEAADAVVELLQNRTLARQVGQCGASLVDGRGALRVAAAIRRMAREVEERSHAA